MVSEQPQPIGRRGHGMSFKIWRVACNEWSDPFDDRSGVMLCPMCEDHEAGPCKDCQFVADEEDGKTAEFRVAELMDMPT